MGRRGEVVGTFSQAQQMAHMQTKRRITERGTQRLSAFNNEPRGQRV